MASALAKQLREIQQADQVLGGLSTPAGKRASFLFDPKEAADFDAEAIYELGMAGLEELQQMDSVFIRFQPILFSSNAIDMDRATLTKKENAEIDENIRVFLRYLSPYLMLKPAHKVLEWLVRKYRINDMNVEAVIECILPYHETTAFVRMVQILYFTDNDKWGFLFDVKKNAKAINRTYLAIRCQADRSILNFVYNSAVWHAKNSVDMKRKNVHVIPFFTYLCLEYINNLPKAELIHVTHLLPMIKGLMESSKTPDLQLSGYMLFSLLCDKFSFAENAMNEILITAAKSCAETCITELLLMFADLIARGHIKSVPEEAFKAISESANAEAAVKKAAARYKIKSLLDNWIQSLSNTFAQENSSLLRTLKSLTDIKV